MRNKTPLVLALLVSLPLLCLAADNYRTLPEIEQQVEQWAAEHPELTTVTSIGKTLEGRDIWLMRLAADGPVAPDQRPALFIGGNIEGYRLLSTEAAMATIEWLLTNSSDEAVAEMLSTRTYYIVPVMNPDVMHATMNGVTLKRGGNAAPVDEDLDGAIDEDGPDDLNGDGFITMMRYKHPEGEWIPHPADDRFMKKADPLKGEAGIYRLETEGLDNDGDGRRNEDGPGGVVLNMNFPHDYQYNSPGAGPWPASELETIAFLEFFFTHRNIAMVFTFSGQNNLLNLQAGKQAAGGGSDRVKVPERFAGFLGLDPDQEYDLDDLVKIINASPILGGQQVTKEQVAIFLGQGPVMSINDKDMPWFKSISDEYKEMLKEKEIDNAERKPTPALGDGSFVTWAYYHYGVPGLTVDLWAVPEPEKEEAEEKEEGLTVEALKEMSADDFVALGEERIAAFIKEQGMEGRVSATMVINMVQSGRVTPEQMAQMIEQRAAAGDDGDDNETPEEAALLDWAAEHVDGGGYVQWTVMNHPELGVVEIGGVKPLIDINPPYDLGREVLAANAEFAARLAGRLSAISFSNVRTESRGGGVYEITGYVQNSGWLPTSMQHGQTNREVLPVVVRLELEDERILHGEKLIRFNRIDGNGMSSRMRWLVRGDTGDTITLRALSDKSGSAETDIVLQ